MKKYNVWVTKNNYNKVEEQMGNKLNALILEAGKIKGAGYKLLSVNRYRNQSRKKIKESNFNRGKTGKCFMNLIEGGENN
jgi:hypothetical protein